MVGLGHLGKFKLFEDPYSVFLSLDLRLTLIFNIYQNQEKKGKSKVKSYLRN